jgi:hypothetical protein
MALISVDKLLKLDLELPMLMVVLLMLVLDQELELSEGMLLGNMVVLGLKI